MTEDEMIAVIQSYKNGKQIQCALKDDNRGCCDWDNVSERCGPQWNFQTHIYRVAPEPRKPREWIIDLDENGDGRAYREPKWGLKPCEGWVRVREVLPND